ncbi:MAG TPA: TadE/TadG family type IV pilus assembly protein [Actinomycetales bacterium]|jgi:Flp pilus assembly protein TadG|nr:TadE/TadG family type IV pilus assembly protein [Actinomycetales bacterium]
MEMIPAGLRRLFVVVLAGRVRSSRYRRDAHGAAAVEFALILAPFLLLLIGMMQYSLWFFAAQSGSASAREAARRSAVGDLTCSTLASTSRDNAGLVTSGFSVKRSYTTFEGNPRTSGFQANDNVKVVVSYQTVNLNFPLIPIPNGGTISETAIARVESVTGSTGNCS